MGEESLGEKRVVNGQVLINFSSKESQIKCFRPAKVLISLKGEGERGSVRARRRVREREGTQEGWAWSWTLSRAGAHPVAWRLQNARGTEIAGGLSLDKGVGVTPVILQ